MSRKKKEEEPIARAMIARSAQAATERALSLADAQLVEGYTIKFATNSLGFWAWSATAPDGTRVPPQGLGGICASRESTERQALRAIVDHASKYELTGAELRDRVLARSKGGS